MFKFWKRKLAQHDDETLLIHVVASTLNEDSGWNMVKIGDVMSLMKNSVTITHIDETVTISSGDTVISVSDKEPIPYKRVKNLFHKEQNISLRDVLRQRSLRIEALVVSPVATMIGRTLNNDTEEYSHMTLADALCHDVKIKELWSYVSGTNTKIIRNGIVITLSGWAVCVRYENTITNFDKYLYPDLYQAVTGRFEDFSREEEDRKKAERKESVKILLNKLLA